MEFRIDSITFVPDPAEFRRFRQDKNKPIGKDLYKRGLRLQQLARTTVPKRSGALASSIAVRYSRGGTNPFVTIGSKLDYAYWVHEGTRPHNIRVNRDRLMRFTVRGRVIYATTVNHPGSRPTHYLSRHLRRVIR
jgi:hypothetical protein